MSITIHHKNPKLLTTFNCDDFISYEKGEEGKSPLIFGKKNWVKWEFLQGIKGNKPRTIHKYAGKYNEFEKELTKVPKGYRKEKSKHLTKEDIQFRNYQLYCGKTIQLTKKNAKKITHKHYRKYFIHDNGTRPFLVYVKGTQIYIYKIREDVYLDEEKFMKHKDRSWAYTKLVKHYNAKKVWIGKSPENPMTRYSGAFGPKFDGNSILLQISKNKYVWIGRTIHQFTMNDEVEIFYSPLGNSNVHYPVIIGTKNIYFIDIFFYVDRKHLPDNLTDEQWTDLYTIYYDQLESHSKAIKSVKIIHNSIE